MFKPSDAAGARSPRARRFPTVAQRLAWRDVLAHRGRSLLVAILIGLPVAGVVAGVTLAASGYPTPQQRVARDLGNAAASLRQADRIGEGKVCAQAPNGQYGCWGEGDSALISVPTPVPLTSAVPAGYRTLTIFAGRTTLQRPLSDGQRLPTDVALRIVDAASPDVAGRWDLVEGSYPSGTDVLVSRTFARDYGFNPGDSVDTSKGTFRIAGVLASPMLWDPTIFAVPTHPLAAGTAEAEVLLFGERRFTAADVKAVNHVGVYGFGRDLMLTLPRDLYQDLGGQWFTASVMFGSLAAVLIAFIAGSAFAIGVRSSRRQLGLLGAVGAPVRLLRRVTLWNAVWIASLGTAGGLVVGLGGGVASVAAIATSDRSYPIWGLNITPGGLLVAALLGVASGLIAAVAPALWVGRVDALEAVRSPESPATPAKPPNLGLVVLAGATAAGFAAYQLTRAQHPGTLRQLLLSGGELVIAAGLIGGTVLCLPLVIVGLARLAPRRPLAVRMVLRDIDRHRGRVVPAIGAVLTAATLASLLMGQTAAQDAATRAARTWQVHPTHILVAATEDPTAKPRDVTAVGDAVDKQLDVTSARTKLTAGLAVLQVPDANKCPDERMGYGRDDWRCDWAAQRESAYPTVVGGPSELRVLLDREPTRAELDALASGVVLTTRRAAVLDGQVLVLTMPVNGGDLQGDPNAPALIPTRRPGLLVTVPDGVTGWTIMSPATAQTLKVFTYDGGVVLDIGRRLTADENDRLQAKLASLGAVNVALPRDPNVPDPPTVWIMLAAATLLVLLVGGLTTGLAVADGVRDEATLAAIGAPPTLRKQTTAAQLAVVVFLGCLLGSVIGIALLRAVVEFGTDAYFAPFFVIPWTHLAVLILGVPAVGAAIAWAVTPASKVLARRRD